ncbi:hypothetical protein BOO88_14790 [Stutzerimonas stutzeri]|nr:hypothetical protein BOO89_04105 [Stutzerimonas stutzeri]AZO90126.1 hypothetical protein BOO88_14790 [Stutzerimonas stutzeri]
MAFFRALFIPWHRVISAEISNALHVQPGIEQSERNPEIRCFAKNIRHGRATSRAKIISVTGGFAPTGDRLLPFFPSKVASVDQCGEIMADPGLLAAQRAMAAIEKSWFNREGKAYRPAKTLP